MANNAAVKVIVQFKDGSSRDGIKVDVGGKVEYTNRNGEAVITGLVPGKNYTAAAKGSSAHFTAGREQKVIISVR